MRRASFSPDVIPPPKMALINARSLVNKTFLLNDFFSSHSHMDFMFITESWTKVGDLTPFSELVPSDCTFFNSPRPNRRGGGLVTILKSSFRVRCRSVPVSPFTSFEAQLLHLDWTVLLGVIYHPPHSIKDFKQQFTEFIGNIATNYDRFLLVGDFNIHVCCQSNPLSKEFLSLVESFGLVQWIKDSTHIQGHTLDLVLSHGFAISDIVVSDYMLSDHKPILFSLSLSNLSYSTSKAITLSRSYSPQFGSNFKQHFMESCSHLLLDSSLPDVDVDQHLRLLNSAWLDSLNVTAPLKPYKPKSKSEPWLNSEIRLLRQACRKAERKWKKDNLHISFQLLKESLLVYQSAVKSAKATYFSNLIMENHSRPKVLFSVINSVVNPPVNTMCTASVLEICRVRLVVPASCFYIWSVSCL